MEELKTIFSKNLITLRKKVGLTQAELAEKLNYSDKAVSKWERSEAIPDASILKQMAAFFNVSIDFLLNEHDKDEINELEVKHKKDLRLIKNNQLIITLVTIIGIWFVALLSFIILHKSGIQKPWLSFIIAIPVSTLLSFIFSCIWARKSFKFITLSAFIWTLLLNVYICTHIWLVFLIGIPAQIITLLCFNLKTAK